MHFLFGKEPLEATVCEWFGTLGTGLVIWIAKLSADWIAHHIENQ